MEQTLEKRTITKNRKGYFGIDNDYVKYYARHLGIAATAVYTSLCMHSDYNTKRCWPSMETIGEQHGLERHAVSRALVKLEEWNIIKTERAIDRKKRKRKNNVYTLLPKEAWKKLPIIEEEQSCGVLDSIDSHGTKDTTPMVPFVPQDGVKDASNETHITKPRELNTNCGQKPTISVSPQEKDLREDQKDIGTTKEPATEVWDYKQELLNLKNSGQKDYLIIGYYFFIKKLSFDNKETFDMNFKRALKPANLLKKYNSKDVRAAIEWCNEAYSQTTGWTLETVLKRIDDGKVDNFTPQKIKMESAKLPLGTKCTPGLFKDVKVLRVFNNR